MAVSKFGAGALSSCFIRRVFLLSLIFECSPFFTCAVFYLVSVFTVTHEILHSYTK